MQEQNERKKSHPLLKYFTFKFLGWIILAVLVIVLALGIGKTLVNSQKTTQIGFENIGELATQAAYCTEVNVTEASRDLWGVTIPFTQSKYVYSYDIILKAGLDFGQIQWDVDERNHVIHVRLPEIRVLSNEIDLDSFQLYHEAESIFREITMEENNAALTDLKKQAETHAIENGLLDGARQNAEIILTGFFAGVYDLGTYTLKFSDL